MTHVGPVMFGKIGGQTPTMPPGVPRGLPLVRKGVFELMSYRENEQYGEKSYMAVYQDVCENEDEWMEVCSCIALYLVYFNWFCFPPLTFAFHSISSFSIQ